MGKTSKYDWEAIGREYRAGILSVREVSRQHKVDHAYLLREAKKRGWKRDLTERVKRAVTTKIVTSEVTTDNASDDEIVEAESDRVVAVLQIHRKDISQGREIVSLLQSQLISAADKRDILEDLIIEDTKAVVAGKVDFKRRAAMLKAVSLLSHTNAIKNLSAALKNLIPLERQAMSIDSRAGIEEIDGIEITFKRAGVQ